jgi:hypothetical protein
LVRSKRRQLCSHGPIEQRPTDLVLEEDLVGAKSGLVEGPLGVEQLQQIRGPFLV